MVKKVILSISIITVLLLSSVILPAVYAAGPPDKWQAHPPIHIKKSATASPTGLSVAQIAHAYGFDLLSCYGTQSCGSGQTIAIVDAYDDPNIANDLGIFSNTFNIPCNNCFQKIYAQGLPRTDSGWALEESLDVEWAHAIAPAAKIVLVEAKSNSLSNLLTAIDVAATQTGASVVSMSWGGTEFSSEANYDNHFNVAGVSFTASSGDSGSGVQWPAVSPYVVGVGGTTLTFDSSGHPIETAWSGSGGGISAYEQRPSYQNGFNSNSGRGVPDVSYDADPNTGISVYDSFGYQGSYGWFVVGGTSAGAPQWVAAIADANSGGAALSSQSYGTDTSLYGAASGTSYGNNYRDITSGSNGGFTATTGYDFVTGLGSPLSNSLIPFLQGPAPSPSPDFSLSATSVTIQQGSTGTSTVSITPSGGFNSGVNLSLSGNPAGVTGSFSPNPATSSSTLTLNVGSTVSTGSYTLTVTGTSGSLTHSTTLTLTVSAPTSSNSLTVNVSTDKSSYTQGTWAYITVHVTSGSSAISGASVNVSVTNPNGGTSTGSGTTDSNGNVFFKYRISPNAPLGAYSVTAQASASGYTSGSGSTQFTVT